MLRLRFLFCGLSLVASCSRPNPRVVEVDGDFERAVQERKRDREALERQDSVVLLIEVDADRKQEAVYRKNASTVPSELLLRRPDKPASDHARILQITCSHGTCEIVKSFEWLRDGVVLNGIPQGTLTWLASTDLLGLPLEKGGRAPLPPAQEGRQLGPHWSPYTRDNDENWDRHGIE